MRCASDLINLQSALDRPKEMTHYSARIILQITRFSRDPCPHPTDASSAR